MTTTGQQTLNVPHDLHRLRIKQRLKLLSPTSIQNHTESPTTIDGVIKQEDADFRQTFIERLKKFPISVSIGLSDDIGRGSGEDGDVSCTDNLETPPPSATNRLTPEVNLCDSPKDVASSVQVPPMLQQSDTAIVTKSNVDDGWRKRQRFEMWRKKYNSTKQTNQKAKFQCHGCGKTYHKLSLFKGHLRDCTKFHTWRKEQAMKESNFLWQQQDDSDAIREEDDRYYDEHDLKQVEDKTSSNMKSSLPVTSSSFRQTCQICLRDFDDRIKFEEDQSKHKQQFPNLDSEVQCPVPGCARVMASKWELNSHVRTHPDMTEAGACCECRILMPAPMLRFHFFKKHNVRSHLCPVCGKMVMYMTQLKAHMAQAHGSDTIGGSNTTSNSIRGAHSVPGQDSAPDAAGVVPKSSQPSSKPDGVTATGVKLPEDGQQQQSTMCEKCGKVFTQPRALRTHIRKIHNKAKAYDCDLCDKVFYHKDKLLGHKMTVHLKLRPFKCRHCEYSCAARSTIYRHCETRHGKRGNIEDIVEIEAEVMRMREVEVAIPPPRQVTEEESYHIRLQQRQGTRHRNKAADDDQQLSQHQSIVAFHFQ